MKKFLLIICTAICAVSILVGCSSNNSSSSSNAATSTQKSLSGTTLHIYCGAGMTDPFQEIANAFQDQTGCQMDITYANAGQIQSQINTSKEGDMFIAGSTDELSPVSSYVASSKDLVKHIPILAVANGNPKNITGLQSLTAPGITFVMGDPDSTPIGKIAKKALTDKGIFDKVNIIATTTTAPQLATAVNAGEADATIVWKENVSAGKGQIVQTSDLDNYVKSVPAATLTFSTQAEALKAFSDFLDSQTARDIWTKYGYELLS